MAELIATTWLDRKSGLKVEVTHFDEVGLMTFAVRNGGGSCLNKEGEWEFEPMPSGRTSEFLERCRWDDFTQAAKALESAALEAATR